MFMQSFKIIIQKVKQPTINKSKVLKVEENIFHYERPVKILAELILICVPILFPVWETRVMFFYLLKRLT